MNKSSKTVFLAIGLTSLAVVLSPMVQATVGASISEPHTIFYGKVMGTGSEQDFLITSGNLQWKILRSDGVEIELETSLFGLNDGTYSYRLHVPHSAFALGLETGTAGIPMPPMPAVNLHAEVTVDGETAALMGPASVVFATEQLLRTATYRMDLALGREALDTDGDGIPDWWEDLYGLDKQDRSDAGLDLNGDGLSALDAYQRGINPHLDVLMPALLTDELVVYPSGTTAILLDTADIDSLPEQLLYTLTDLRLAGKLILRNAHEQADAPDRQLQVGDTFTQADLLGGRVVYEHDASLSDPGIFNIDVRDENPAHVADSGVVRLLAFQAEDPAPPVVPHWEARSRLNHTLAAGGSIILDASGVGDTVDVSNPSAGLDTSALEAYRLKYGDDRPYVLIGGDYGARLQAGHRDDVLIATAAGAVLTGGPGADRFLIDTFDQGRIMIADFAPEEGDVLDLSGITAPVGASALDYIRFVDVGDGVELQVSLAGTGAGFTNVTVAVPGLQFVDDMIYELVSAQSLAIGNLRLASMVSVLASVPQASQVGPAPG